MTKKTTDNNTGADETPKRIRSKIILSVLSTIGVVTLGGFLYWTNVCPCERTPGFILFGEKSTEQITDWSFANQVPLCQIQVYAGWRPHSINLNCMATEDGKLYLSCSSCAGKFWSNKVLNDSRGRIRLNGIVYPVKVTRVENALKLDEIWKTRITKLQILRGNNASASSDTPRADGWWSFHVESAI